MLRCAWRGCPPPHFLRRCWSRCFPRRRVRPLEILLSLVVIVGLYLIFRFEFDQSLGLGLALASAFLAALFTIANSRFVKKHNALLITFYEMNGATLGMLIGLIGVALSSGLSKEEVIPQPIDWIWIVILASVCTVYAYSAESVAPQSIAIYTQFDHQFRTRLWNGIGLLYTW